MIVSIIKALNKKHQNIILNKIFDVINIIFVMNNLFDIGGNEYNIKLMRLIKKILRKIVIEDNFVVKMDRATVNIIDKFNEMHKHNCHNTYNDGSADGSSTETDSMCDNECTFSDDS